MKTCAEMSAALDLLYNNIMSDKAPGLEEYEKSILLTQAQEGLVKDFFSPKTNALLEGFDGGARRQSDFASLIDSIAPTVLPDGGSSTRFIFRSAARYYEYPKDIFIILNEEVRTIVDEKENFLTVVPISFEEYSRLMKKPYKFPPKGQAWRLLSGGVMELVGKFPSEDPGNIVDYTIRYVKRPEPIVLEAIPETRPAIENVRTPQMCKLPEHLHDEIVQRAVLLAKVAWADAVAPQAQQNK